MRKAFSKGLIDGLPIGIGYLSVSFGFGISAAALNIPTLFAWLISATNLTSAGQAAGIEIIAACGTLLEMALTQLVINLRYALMGFSLTQKLDGGFTTLKRLVLSFGITDEIFGVSVTRVTPLSPFYSYGLMSVAIPGWTLGTVLGVISGTFLPQNVINALGIAIYGMFIAIIIPEAKKEKSVLITVISAMLLSCGFYYLPFIKEISDGFRIIIITIAVSALMAVLFPRKEEQDEN